METPSSYKQKRKADIWDEYKPKRNFSSTSKRNKQGSYLILRRLDLHAVQCVFTKTFVKVNKSAESKLRKLHHKRTLESMAYKQAKDKSRTLKP